MKIQTRLSLISSALWGVVFIIVALLIFALYKKNIEKSIYYNLEKTARITAFYFFEKDEVTEREFIKIEEQYDDLSNTYFQIYDDQDILWLGKEEPEISRNIIKEIRKKEELAFTTKDFLCYGIYYKDNQGDFVIITKDRKEELYNYLNPLLWILLSAFALGMLATILLNRWIAYIAYRPIRETIQQVKGMSPDTLVQLETTKTGDELQDLTETFNELLVRISDTFKIQQNFVSYVSHEFKTPLTAIQGNLEVFSLKDRSPEEYHQLAETLIQEIYQLEEILDILLVVSDMRKNTDIPEQIRIDELVEEIIRKVSDKYLGFKGQVKFNSELSEDNKHLLQVNIDRTQLFMALFNLIENAVKFSQGKEVEVRLYPEDKGLGMSITDQGIGIPEEQLKKITRPFFRADNTIGIAGKGIGLSIALRILDKNSIEYTIGAEVNKGTEVLLKFS